MGTPTCCWVAAGRRSIWCIVIRSSVVEFKGVLKWDSARDIHLRFIREVAIDVYRSLPPLDGDNLGIGLVNADEQLRDPILEDNPQLKRG